jgi:N-acetylmuramoyl-L-alanine amidase
MLRVLIVLLISASLYTSMVFASNGIEGVRVSPSQGHTRVVLDVKQAPDFTYFTLKSPDRLVIDLAHTNNSGPLALDKASNLIKRIRYSTAKHKDSTRVVFDLARKATPTVFAMTPSAPYGHRLVIDFDDPQAPKQQVIINSQQNKRDRDIIVAIDAGHGGTDPGSVGPSGTYEKTITLSIAKRLEAMINKEVGMRAVMIRTGDYYISPNGRPERARKHKADLLISIHADAFTAPGPRGASVWVLNTRRADSELGRWLEKTERHSELLGGAAEVISDNASERYLAETILGLSMDHSISTSYDLSYKVIDEMKKVTRMHKAIPQAASLAVLTAPDIPSILVEVGFISNPQEEKNLNWSQYREKLASSLFSATKRYFHQAPPDGTLWSSLRGTNRTHKVRSGESLSLLAQRYNVKVSSIKKANNLRNDMVRIGQVLTIPST